MTMYPRFTEERAISRRQDLERSFSGHRLPPTPSPVVDSASPAGAHASAATHRPRGAVSRRVGVLLIAVGLRLVDSDGIPAFDGPRRR
jgi:hypothetical protein